MPSLARWKSLKVRSGRRPISVTNLLKKEKDGTLFKYALQHIKKMEASAEREEEEEEGSFIEKSLKRLRERRGENADGSLKYAARGYKLQGERDFQGLDVAIENRVGSIRKGTNDDGTEWKTKFKLPYGFIRGTKGADGEPVDCYVGPDRGSETAYVVRQRDDAGKYDEDTVMLGFPTSEAAKKGIAAHYDDSKYIGRIIPMAMERLKEIFETRKVHAKLASRADIEYSTDHPQDDTIVATLKRRRSEPPARDDVHPMPSKVEDRRDVQGTMTVGPMLAHGGQQDIGKFAKALETIGNLTRTYEPPSADEDNESKGQSDGSTGGLTRAGDPRAMSEDFKVTTQPFSRTFTDIGVATNQDKEAAAARARSHATKPMGKLDVLHKIARLQEVYSTAFFDELDKLASADPALEELIEKQALTMAMPNVMGGLRAAGQGVSRAVGRLKPKALTGDAATVASFRKGRGITGFGKDLAAGGKQLAHNPQAAGRAAGLGTKDLASLQRMRPTSAGRRITGEVAHGAGHHIQHANPAMLALNPVGVPLGGAIEGLSRGTGKELQRHGHSAVQATGRALQKHAPKIGFGGEVVAGGLMHAPGLASVLGGAMAPGAHGVAQHAMGSVAQSVHRVAPRAAQGISRAAPYAGRALQHAGRMMGVA